MNKLEIEELELIYAIRLRLYYESRINDASRIFSWLRTSSELCLRLEKKLKETSDKLHKLYNIAD